MPQNTAEDQLKPERFIDILPEILATLRQMNAHKLRVVPIDGGGFEVEVVTTNRLYVSRRELADMMPRFSSKTDTAIFVDRLVALGIPHVNPTGSRLFNVPRVVAWLDQHFGVGGRQPTAQGIRMRRR